MSRQGCRAKGKIELENSGASSTFCRAHSRSSLADLTAFARACLFLDGDDHLVELLVQPRGVVGKGDKKGGIRVSASKVSSDF